MRTATAARARSTERSPVGSASGTSWAARTSSDTSTLTRARTASTTRDSHEPSTRRSTPPSATSAAMVSPVRANENAAARAVRLSARAVRHRAAFGPAQPSSTTWRSCSRARTSSATTSPATVATSPHASTLDTESESPSTSPTASETTPTSGSGRPANHRSAHAIVCAIGRSGPVDMSRSIVPLPQAMSTDPQRRVGPSDSPPERAQRNPTLAPRSIADAQLRAVVRRPERGDCQPPPRST